MDTQIQANVTQATLPELGQRPAVKLPPVQQVQEPTKPTRQEITREALETATKKVQSFVEAKTSELQFAVDDASGVQVVRVFDKGTKELIRQIPSQEMLDMAVALDRIQGLLVKQKA